MDRATLVAVQAAEEERSERFIDQVKAGLKEVTPTLPKILLVTVATGFALAIGAGLGAAFMNRYLTPSQKTSRGGARGR